MSKFRGYKATSWHLGSPRLSIDKITYGRSVDLETAKLPDQR